MGIHFLIEKKAKLLDSKLGMNFSDFEVVETSTDLKSVNYCCISYVWGLNTIEHPYDPLSYISKRTLPVLNTAFKAFSLLKNNTTSSLQETKHFWIDSLCICHNARTTQFHFSAMAEIYGNASLVIVVLSKYLNNVVTKIRSDQPFIETDFEELCEDGWFGRYWTYQEFVNAKNIFFTFEGNDKLPIDGCTFLDSLANKIVTYCKQNKLSTIEFHQKYPYLTSLEAVILDWLLMDYQERSVYQVMVNMEYRESNVANSKLKAMFGCIADELGGKIEQYVRDYDLFIELCKLKGDFSFIFNTSMDRGRVSKTWLPNSYDFKPIFSWLYCFGEGQEGKLTQEHLELYNVLDVKRGTTSLESANYLRTTLSYGQSETHSSLSDLMSHYLKELKFNGNLFPIELEYGYYFNQNTDEIQSQDQIFVCKGVHWTFGAPAMVLRKTTDSAKFQFVSSGVFFGDVNEKKLPSCNVAVI